MYVGFHDKWLSSDEAGNVGGILPADFPRFFNRFCRNNFATESGGNRRLWLVFGGILSDKILSLNNVWSDPVKS